MKISVAHGALMVAAFGALTALPAHADPDDRAEIRALLARVKALEAKVARQEKETAKATNVANAAQAAVVKGPPLIAPGIKPVIVSFKNGLTVETVDKEWYFKFGGRLFVDGGTNTFPVQTFPNTGWAAFPAYSVAKPWADIFPSHAASGYANNITMRQVRMEIEGKAARDYFYKFQVDFAGSPNGLTLGMLRDVWLAYRWQEPWMLQPITFQIGNQFEPHSLERSSSSKYRDFIERAMADDVLGGNRHIGLSAVTGGDAPGLLGKPVWNIKSGIFSTSLEDGNPQGSTTANALATAALATASSANTPCIVGGVATTCLTSAALSSSTAAFVNNIGIPAGNSAFLNPVAGGHQYWDAATRIVYAPIHTDEALLHIGGSVRYQKPGDATAAGDDRVLQPGFTLKSEANAVGDQLLQTQPLTCVSPLTQVVGGNCVKSVFTPAAEFVAAYGPVSVQGEYLAPHYTRDAGLLAWYNNPVNGTHAPGGTSINFRGFYVYATWYLTGESRAEAYHAYPEDFNAPSTFGQIKNSASSEPGRMGSLGARGSLQRAQPERRAPRLLSADHRHRRRLLLQPEHPGRPAVGRHPRPQLVSRKGLPRDGQLGQRRPVFGQLRPAGSQRYPSADVRVARSGRLVSPSARAITA